MPLPVKQCRNCGEEFMLTPNKPGNINDCANCSQETAVKFMAKVSYPSKNASEVQIELTQNHKDAKNFNDAQKHHWSKAY